MSVTSPFNPAAGDRRNGSPAGPVATPGAPPSTTGDRLPRPPRRRRPGFAALAVLLIAGSAAAAGLLAVQLDERVPVIVAKREIQPGRQITTGDLAVAHVASSEIQPIKSSDARLVVGKYATQPIPAGRLIDKYMLGDESLLGPGDVALGIVLKPGNVPATGVRTGDRVKLYRAQDGAATLLTEDAVISSVTSEEGSGAFGGSAGGDAQATVIVADNPDSKLSTQIAGASLAGQIVIGLSERGGGSGS